MNGSTNMVHIYSGIPFSLKNKGISDTCYNMDELENIMQVKYTCHRRINIIQFHLHEVLRVVRFTERESRVVFVSREGPGNEDLVFNGYKVPICKTRKVLELNSGDDCTKA